MYTKSWYEFISPYSANGIEVSLFGNRIHLTQKDVCYLLREVYLIARAIPRLDLIPIGFIGYQFDVPHADWMKFEKDLLNEAKKGGWTSECCKPISGWLKDSLNIKK